MKTILLATALIFFQQSLSAQIPTELLDKVFKAQRNLKTISYRLNRQDTLVTGDNRTVSGQAKIQVNAADKVFGFSYWGRRDGVNRETVYDGKSVLDVNHGNKTYQLTKSPVMFAPSLGQPGGQMIYTDLIRLDTTTVTAYDVTEDSKNYYLTMHFPDKKELDLAKRYKKLTIDKILMLPVGIKNHQETLGKVQDLTYIISDIHINDPLYAYDFSAQRFPGDYLPAAASAYAPSPLLLKPAPLFELTSFDNKSVNLKALEGKVVLLDFWEVWCSPCIGSMPKVDSLYKMYRDKGLEVYGIVNDVRQVESSKLFLQKRKVEFPSLIGSQAIEKDYFVNGIPYYILIDKKGVIAFMSYGYTDKLEEAIRKLM
ncbi:TlpA family protein disulfide reductase [Daejeonella lutea]|uniref:Thiol-disulfide isomerase or thioredoxin n=1 Tax=Daejeonella lutea TaxID=572036 RepID=A0A1T5BU81_9SPHI|nr:TlpA disulfide reductase family protein [Daejeonella lutea]SKB50888.1 Thiol-disulfide isomerase or thioredoxin [Daejeonella lutea]